MDASYNRLSDWGDRTNLGSKTIQTSGNLWLTGKATFTQDWSLHSYQVVPLDKGGSWDGDLTIEVSNDNINWTPLTGFSWTDQPGAQVAYSDTWTFAYARPIITGSESTQHYIINERHLE